MNNCLYCGKPVKNKYCDVSCQNRHQNTKKAEVKYGEIKKFVVLCKKCNKEIEVEEREKIFPMKKSYYCSRSCANSRDHSEETKQQIRKSLIKDFNQFSKIKVEKIIKPRVCVNCGCEFENENKRKKCCCDDCTSNKRKIGSIKGGRQSVLNQNKRSKNEILFGDLCMMNFADVRFNEPIFNGWDADVIIQDYKLAILWDGNWHHKQIGSKHSLLQVQNRDKIKIKEIIKSGYEPYIIKDYGKYDIDFVKKEFEKLKKYIS
jgi:hypothetical protein